MSESKLGEKNPSYGKPVLLETKDKISKALKGVKREKWTEERKQASSDARKGLPGTPHTEATKQKLSEDRAGDKTSAAKLTWQLVNQIRAEHATGTIGYIKLSKKYNVSCGTIAHIIKNRTWKI